MTHLFLSLFRNTLKTVNDILVRQRQEDFLGVVAQDKYPTSFHSLVILIVAALSSYVNYLLPSEKVKKKQEHD